LTPVAFLHIGLETSFSLSTDRLMQMIHQQKFNKADPFVEPEQRRFSDGYP
jgi:hypothetical protein